MTIPTIQIHDAETGEVVVREMNQEEMEAWRNANDQEEKQLNELKLKRDQRQELLDKLGITEEEARLLLS
jgi:mevalonate kinase